MSEEMILQGCLDKLAIAQEELYKQFSPKMLGVCYRYAHNREDAEDMLQEGFIKVFSQIHQFKGVGSLEGWIRKIIVHTCINALKKNKKFSDSVDLALASTVPINNHNIPSILQAKRVVECIRLLPIGYRTVLNLYAIEGYSHKEIGEMVGITEGASKSQLSRARSILKDMVIKMEDKRYGNAG